MSVWAAKQITKQRAQFRNWLASNGAEVLEPTNEWELVRFRSGDVTSVLYKDKSGNTTFTSAALEAWSAFKGAHPWRAAPATKRKPKSPPRLAAIRQRDGGHCFYCLKPVSVEEESEEHLVAVTHGGPNHISNLFLTHRVCNAKAGHLSAPEKIALHVAAHLKAVITTTKEIAA